MNRSQLVHMRTTITGARSLLSFFFYGSVEMCSLRQVLKDAGVDIDLNHERGGVMDHLANIIEALDQAIGDGEPGDREPHFPAPDANPDCCDACGNYLAPTTVCRCEGTGNG